MLLLSPFSRRNNEKKIVKNDRKIFLFKIIKI